MNLTARLGISAGTAMVAAAVLGVPPAGASNGIQFSENDVEGSVYVECLGESIEYKEHIDIAFHEFETPSGTYHMVDNWRFTLTATGESSGRKWAGVLTAPAQMASGPAEVFQVSIQGVMRSLTKHEPAFFWGLAFKTTVNANGELVVERGSFDTFARCLGPQ